MNSVYLSTGAFTGRINHRNPDLLAQYFDRVRCDGFELMVMDNFYEQLGRIISLYQRCGVRICCVHADKHIGDLISCPDSEAFVQAEKLFSVNCEIAQTLGAEKIVVHCWGIPDSDRYPEQIYGRVEKLVAQADRYGLDFLVENCVCTQSGPLVHLQKLAELIPEIGFVIDTRPAQFHGQLQEQCESAIWKKNVRHLHINDYGGGLMQWDALYPILQPTKGKIDWDFFARSLQKNHYTGSITLEAPSMLEQGFDAQTFQRSIDFIRNRLCPKNDLQPAGKNEKNNRNVALRIDRIENKR